MAIKDFRAYVDKNITKEDQASFNKDNIRGIYDQWQKDGSIKMPTIVPTVIPKDESTSKLGGTSTSNVMKEKLEGSIEAAGDTARKSGEEKADIYKKTGEEQKEIIAKGNVDARKKAGDREDFAKDKLDTEKANIALRREDAQSLFDRQEKIANRQSQISGANIGESGLQLSASAMAGFKDDIIAKYGENIMTAEDLKNKTNQSLDSLTSKYMGEYLTNQKEIDMFTNSLDDEEMKPVLNALDKAAEGETGAAQDAFDYWAEVQKKKIEGETSGLIGFEVQEDKQRQWEAGDQRQKGDTLSFTMGDNAWAMDQYWANPDAFQDMSLTEAASTLQKIVTKVNDLNNPGLIQYLTNKATVEAAGKKFTEDDSYEKILQEATKFVGFTDRTQEDKTEARGDTGKTTTEVSDLSDKHMASLDGAYDRMGKEKVLESIVKLEETNPKLYDSITKYINNK